MDVGDDGGYGKGQDMWGDKDLWRKTAATIGNSRTVNIVNPPSSWGLNAGNIDERIRSTQ